MTHIHPFTTVLQNENNKYNIISQNSNTHQKYKKMAGLSYFKTARTHSSSEQQLTNQYRLIHAILECKNSKEKTEGSFKKLKQKYLNQRKDFFLKQCTTKYHSATLIQLAAQRRCKCGGILMEGFINLEYLGTSKVFAM